MSLTDRRHWKCDRCDLMTQTTLIAQPPMWGSVQWITGGVPEAAESHPHWSRWHLCSGCIDSLMDWLGSPEPDDGIAS